ncbi:PREDICTED: uncharacterized protein LOC106115740 [Papilio xuthus]|uniref:Uncharacterized protein LOC106115740 n=1 Tax=Papilio xuthus TaxID=66420 RepID=A0AAJ6Z3N0_PAPXU|nr:PREDICTED: uncharacterized protein LOC106115740 [Papilio xuthus]
MGGCRCSYRNCAVKSDGKTHMFHYPVFDKVRCHQWIVNARRLDFLDLKVSQVKNRVICQHHFKDECFMNFTKGKLTFEAVPTEDGPYCDSSKLVDNSHEFSKHYPIVVEDIENDLCPLDDKKANFSLKYSDFLTNSETPESSFLKTEDNKLKTTQCANLADINFILGNNLDDKLNNININQGLDDADLFNEKLTAIKNNIRKSQQLHPVLIVPPFTQITNLGTTKNEHSEININSLNNAIKNDMILPKPKPRVKIISEKKVTEPVLFTGQFTPISPSIVVNPVLKQNIQTPSNIEQTEPKNVSLNQSIEQLNLIEITVPPPEEQRQNITIQNDIILNETNNTTQNVVTSKTLLKNKIPTKRVADKQEKRKFNKKLKDVESPAIKIEEPKHEEIKQIEEIVENCQENVQTEPEINTLHIINTQNDDYLSRLEARMTRMENLLLNKIDQNSQKIIDLTQSLGTSTQKNKGVSTQTNDNIALYKKYLYTEISQYLSSETKNILYEELFINEQFSQKSNLRSTRLKRRKYR